MTAQIVTLKDSPADRDVPEAAMHALADGLTAHGFDVTGPVWEQCSRLNITNVRGALCEMNLRHDGHMTWEYQPCHGTHTDPAHIAEMVMRLLDGETAEPASEAATRRPGLTFKGAVGRTLAERGMTVRLVTFSVTRSITTCTPRSRSSPLTTPPAGTCASPTTVWSAGSVTIGPRPTPPRLTSAASRESPPTPWPGRAPDRKKASAPFVFWLAT
jgi:hypothetical protein